MRRVREPTAFRSKVPKDPLRGRPAKNEYVSFSRWVTVDPVLPGQNGTNQSSGTNTWGGINGNTYVLNQDPNWKVKVAKGQNASLPYRSKTYEGEPAVLTGKVISTLSGPSRLVVSTGLTSFNAFESEIPKWTDLSVSDLALKRLKAKLSNHLGLYNAMVPIAELRELRKGITGLAGSAIDTVLQLGRLGRRGRLTARGLRTATSDAWLQWSFGIKPLLSDIRQANEAISTFLTREDHTVRLTGSAYLERTARTFNGGTGGPYGASIDSFGQGYERLWYKYVGAFDFKFSTGNAYGVRNIFGLDVESIPSSIWELTPYSWLIDYFTSVGDYLDDTFVLPPGSLKYLTLTRYQEYKLSVSMRLKKGFSDTVLADEHCVPGFTLMRDIERSTLATLPHLSLRIKTLDEVGRNGLTKLANLLALLKSAHGGQMGQLRRLSNQRK